MGKVDKFYPVQGTNKFETVSFPITKAMAVDFGAQAAGTVALFAVPKGAQVLGFTARITEAMESASAATVQIGFTGSDMLSTAHGSGAAVLNTIIAPPSTSTYNPYFLTAADTFDIIVASTACTAGKMDIFLTYIPIPNVDLSTSDFMSVVTA